MTNPNKLFGAYQRALILISYKQLHMSVIHTEPKLKKHIIEAHRPHKLSTNTKNKA